MHGELIHLPISGEAFIFPNHQGDKIKMLHWEQGGFVLYYKRPEIGTFRLPRVSSKCEPDQLGITTENIGEEK